MARAWQTSVKEPPAQGAAPAERGTRVPGLGFLHLLEQGDEGRPMPGGNGTSGDDLPHLKSQTLIKAVQKIALL